MHTMLVLESPLDVATKLYLPLPPPFPSSLLRASSRPASLSPALSPLPPPAAIQPKVRTFPLPPSLPLRKKALGA